MNKMSEQQNLWIDADLRAVEEWATFLFESLGNVEVLVQPRPALVVMHARDSVEREPFCLGEVLVTECQIACRRQRFWGRVAGDRSFRALALAILAAAKVLEPDAVASLGQSFSRERERLKQGDDRQKRALGTTKVNFETMTPT